MERSTIQRRGLLQPLRLRRLRDKGGSTKSAPKKAKTEKYCQRCKTHGGAHQTHNTNECRRYDKDGKPTGHFGSKTSKKHKPFKKGGKKGLAYMTSMLEAIAKGQKKIC